MAGFRWDLVMSDYQPINPSSPHESSTLLQAAAKCGGMVLIFQKVGLPRGKQITVTSSYNIVRAEMNGEKRSGLSCPPPTNGSPLLNAVDQVAARLPFDTARQHHQSWSATTQ